MAIDFEVSGHIATITINRPEAMNSLDPEAQLQFSECWTKVREDDNIRVVILTGAGDRAFSAGSDLKKTIPSAKDKSFAQMAFGGSPMPNPFENWGPKPVIAAINGLAVGGGLEMAMCADIRIAVPGVRIGLTEVKVGSIPGGGGTQRLPRLVGMSNAMHMLLTADIIDSEEAYRIGLISKLVAPEDLMNEARAIAERIASNAPLAVRAVKKLAIDGQNMSLDDGLATEKLTLGVLMNSKDRIEGRTAFKEKRKPVYRGE